MRTRFERASRPALRALLVLMAVTLVNGCGIFSPDEAGDDGPVVPVDPWIPATTTAQFITNFERAWEERDLERYDELLGEDFIFYLASQDINEIGIGFWDRAEEMDTARQMFGTPDSDPSLTVESIEFSEFVPTVAFSDQIEDPDLADADLVGTYRVSLIVGFPGDDANVRGEQEFYLKKVEREIDGQTLSVYVLRAWKDLGVD